LLHCPEGFRPRDATRPAPASVEYLRRNTGLNHELSILSSKRCNLMSHRRVGAGGYPPTPPSEPYLRVSPHTAQVLIRPAVSLADPLPDPRPVAVRQLGHTHRQPRYAVLLCGDSSGTPQPPGGGCHLLSRTNGGSTGSLAIANPTDVGLSSALPLALASSVIPRLRPPTRLAVRSARSRGRAGLAAFPCSALFTG
jgi:hypothetical protein